MHEQTGRNMRGRDSLADRRTQQKIKRCALHRCFGSCGSADVLFEARLFIMFKLKKRQPGKRVFKCHKKFRKTHVKKKGDVAEVCLALNYATVCFHSRAGAVRAQ